MAKIHNTIIPFAGCFDKSTNLLESSDIVLLGLASDTQSSFRSGARKAPEHIRNAYDGYCFTATTESGVDLYKMVTDLGDLSPKVNWEQTSNHFQIRAESIFKKGKNAFFLGGDHAITIPVVEALSSLGQPVHFIQFDAHPDLYPDYEGDIYSHACVAARILEMNHVASVTQIGIRTMNHMQQQLADRYENKLRIFNASSLQNSMPSLAYLPKDAPVYISIDMDCFDPAFAPGVSHPVPGGLTSRQVLNFLLNMRWNLVGMDVVELNPAMDINNQTAILAARLLHEAMGTTVPKE